MVLGALEVVGLFFVVITAGVMIPQSAVVPQYGSPLKHLPDGGEGHDTHTPETDEHAGPITCKVSPLTQSFCTLHFLHVTPSFQYPVLQPQEAQPTAVQVALLGRRLESHTEHTVLSATPHARSILSPATQSLHWRHWESDVPVHGDKYADARHDRCEQTVHES